MSSGQLLAGLARAGARIRAIAPITPDALRRGDEFAAEHPELSITRILLPFFEINPPSAPEDYRAAEGALIEAAWASLVADRRPEVVFIGRETFAWHTVPLARSDGFPSLLRMAGGTMNAVISGRLSPPLSRSLLAQLHRVDLLVAPARHLAESTRALGLQNVTTIVNALDLVRFTPRPKDPALLRSLGLAGGDVVVVHASNLKPVKRPLDIVQAVPQALRECPRLTFVIVGDGPLREAMEEACRRLGLTERFRFVGWVPYREMPRYINLADIVVMPSEGEALARVYMETQACGRVLVASDILAAREVVVDGETGLLFRKGDVQDLAAKITWTASRPETCAEIGRRAREQAVRLHALDNAIRAYLASLRDVAGNGA